MIVHHLPEIHQHLLGHVDCISMLTLHQQHCIYWNMNDCLHFLFGNCSLAVVRFVGDRGGVGELTPKGFSGCSVPAIPSLFFHHIS